LLPLRVISAVCVLKVLQETKHFEDKIFSGKLHLWTTFAKLKRLNGLFGAEHMVFLRNRRGAIARFKN